MRPQILKFAGTLFLFHANNSKSVEINSKGGNYLDYRYRKSDNTLHLVFFIVKQCGQHQTMTFKLNFTILGHAFE